MQVSGASKGEALTMGVDQLNLCVKMRVNLCVYLCGNGYDVSVRSRAIMSPGDAKFYPPYLCAVLYWAKWNKPLISEH